MKRYIVSILIGIVPLFLSTACKERFEFEEQRSITIEASFSDDNTRADLEQASGSRDLITRWNEDDVIRLYLFQDGKGYTLDPVKVYNISSDGKRCSFGFKLPSDISLDHSYDIYGLCDAEGVIQEEESLVVAKSQLKRMHWNDRKVPMWFHSTGGNSSIQASFRHLGTYEVLHITNTSKLGVMFRHDGFDVETPWYKSYENTPLKDDYDPTQYVQEPGDDAQSGSVYLGAGQTEKYLSWYIPTGATINEATLLATIDGKTVSSVNTKSSSVRIQRGRAYHMYATWDGTELKFDGAYSNDLTVTPTSIDFERVEYGTDKTATFTVTNTGDGILRFSIACECHDDVFEVEGGEEQTLAAGASKEFTVTAHGMKRNSSASCDIRVIPSSGEGSKMVSVQAEGWDNKPLTLENYSKTIRVGDKERVNILFGSLDYEIHNENPSVVNAIISTQGEGGGGWYDYWRYTFKYVNLEGLTVGTSTIIVTDKERNEEVKLFVSVTENGSTYAVPEAVDLGLSVKWASFNLGATKLEEYGNYYAWGETEPKDDYSWETYKWCMDGSPWSLTKYCKSSNFGYNGYTDDKTVLDPEDDAARVSLGLNWRIPTDAEMGELWSLSYWKWTSQNGVDGYWITGPSGNSIFLPAAGTRYGYDLVSPGYGHYWNSSRHSSSDFQDMAGAYIFNSENRQWLYSGLRNEGLTIRPVYDEGYAVNSVRLNETNLNLKVGDNVALVAIISPANATNTKVKWSTSDKLVADVSSTGFVYCISPGEVIITATTYDGGKEATCHLSIDNSSNTLATPNIVDLGLSVKWGSFNLGATRPEEYGFYYLWGETESNNDKNRWDKYKWGYGTTMYKYNGSDDKTILELEDDAAHVELGGTWRMPTKEEIDELINNCTWIWNKRGGTNGYTVIGKSGNSIFIPTSGYLSNGKLYENDYSCNVWSSNVYLAGTIKYINAYILSFDWYEVELGVKTRKNYGLPIRPVYGEPADNPNGNPSAGGDNGPSGGDDGLD